MLGGRHRHRVRSEVEAVLGQAPDDAGEAAGEEVRAEVAGVEQHVVGAGEAHPVDDAAGHHVPGGELATGVEVGHEPVAALVEQDRSLATQRLGDERLLAAGAAAQPQHGRVELDELQVGEDRPCPQRGGDTVPGGLGRVRRRPVHLADAAAGEDHGAGGQLLGAVRAGDQHPAGSTGGVGQHVDGEGVLERAGPARRR